MKSRLSPMLIAIMVLLQFSYLPPCCLSQNYSQSYQLLDSPDGSKHFRLNVMVSQSLYEYYGDQSHRLRSSGDFAKFVTPHALEPIADSLWEVYTDDEDFANGVLMIVHQIPYDETLPVKYPVETIVENEGDCDLFSYIAVSILKAGGLDVVLLYYESEEHMNVGVRLSHAPHDVRGGSCYVTDSNGVHYYVSECTGGNWRDGWRVGECPDDLNHASAQVVALADCEQWAPGQVSASYESLESSAISLTVSSVYVIQGSTVTFLGQLSPALENETVTIYVKVNNFLWSVLETVTTGSNGQFGCREEADVAGVHYVRASWSGDDDYAAADSPIRHVMVLSVVFIFLLVITVVLVCVGIAIFLVSKRGHQQVEEPQPPEIPL